MTQDGSRFVQNHFIELTATERADALQQVLENDIVGLSKHVFANWVIQLIYEYSTYPQCEQIVDALQGHILELSLNTFGCRLIQKIICTENKADDIKLKQHILSELHNNTLECLRNNNGHHVIEKILSNCPSSLSCFILREIIPQLMALAVDPFGCQIIELILQKFSFNSVEIKELMVRITSNISAMSKHRFGNYIIQDVIESAPLNTQDKMFKAIFENIEELACNKYSSNVVEKSIYLASSKRRRKLVRLIVNDNVGGNDDDDEDEEENRLEITEPSNNDNTILKNLIADKFGNYVIQTLLLCSGKKDRQKLMDTINVSCPNLSQTPYGKHILNAINKVMKQNI